MNSYEKINVDININNLYQLMTLFETLYKGYENRISGLDLQEKTGINYKIISQKVLDLQADGVPVFNLNGGYFYATYKDLIHLQQKEINIKKEYIKCNQQLKLIEELKKDMSYRLGE